MSSQRCSDPTKSAWFFVEGSSFLRAGAMLWSCSSFPGFVCELKHLVLRHVTPEYSINFLTQLQPSTTRCHHQGIEEEVHSQEVVAVEEAVHEVAAFLEPMYPPD